MENILGITACFLFIVLIWKIEGRFRHKVNKEIDSLERDICNLENNIARLHKSESEQDSKIFNLNYEVQMLKVKTLGEEIETRKASKTIEAWQADGDGEIRFKKFKEGDWVVIEDNQIKVLTDKEFKKQYKRKAGKK